MRGVEAVGVPLGFRDEAESPQHVGVFGRSAAEHLELAVAREDLAGQHLHHGGLAGAVPTEEAVDAVLLEREVDGVDGRERAVALGESVHTDHGAGHDWILSARRSPASSSMSMPSFSASMMSGLMYSAAKSALSTFDEAGPGSGGHEHADPPPLRHDAVVDKAIHPFQCGGRVDAVERGELVRRRDLLVLLEDAVDDVVLDLFCDLDEDRARFVQCRPIWSCAEPRWFITCVTNQPCTACRCQARGMRGRAAASRAAGGIRNAGRSRASAARRPPDDGVSAEVPAFGTRTPAGVGCARGRQASSARRASRSRRCLRRRRRRAACGARGAAGPGPAGCRAARAARPPARAS